MTDIMNRAYSMKKTISITLFFSVFTFCINAFSTHNERVIIIAGDQWCPYVCKSKDKPGFSVELVKRALKEMQYETQYVWTNFPRLIRYIKAGKWDVVTGTDKSFSPDLLISKKPVAYTRWVYVTKKDLPWVYQGPESLKNLVLGTVAGYVYSPELMAYINKNKNTDSISTLHSARPQEANLKMLRLGRIDVFIGEESVIKHWAKEIGAVGEFRIAGLDFKKPLFCGLNKKDKKLSETIDKGIEKFTKTKEFKKLLKRYHINNWQSL